MAGSKTSTTLASALPSLLSVLSHFRPHLRGQRGLIAVGFGALFAEVILRLLEPWPLKFIFDRVIQPTPGEVSTGIGWADALDPTTLLIGSAVAIVVLTGLRAAAAYAMTVAFALAGNRVLTTVRSDLYGHLQRMSLSYHARARGGDLITRITGDVGRLQEVTVTAALPLIGNLVTFAGMLAIMLWRSWSLTLIALAVFPLFALTMIRLTTRIRAVSRKQREQEGEMASVASESFGAIGVVQSYSLEDTLSATFASSNQQSLTDGVKAKRLAAGMERKTDVMVAISTGLVLYFGARLVIGGSLTPGDLVLFMTYLKSAFKPMRDLAKYTGRLAKAAASGERIVSVLQTAPDIQDDPKAREAPAFRGEVHIDGVTFGYDPAHPVLHDLDVRAHAGQRIALVGPSGAGKSSIVSLLPRLYDPQGGRILIDGVDIREYTLSSVRGQIGIVLQDSVLFATSIRENIAYGALGCTDREIERAAKLANAHEFITALPDGYDTVVSERGSTLSGGQRQRIAIARAAVRDAPVIILDEPTTGLDKGNEDEVIDALAHLTRGRTTFVIAHDLRTVADADRILYVEQGRVVETGTHEQLLRAQGRYAAVHALQERTNQGLDPSTLGPPTPGWADAVAG
ncbi:MAG: ABC transporter ATP-binding protein/permease [Actinomycetota bacterium]|nr:ABC transporter ATP-binding protein/permease [Actinomycetota bacterium]